MNGGLCPFHGLRVQSLVLPAAAVGGLGGEVGEVVRFPAAIAAGVAGAGCGKERADVKCLAAY